jgi:mRNA interferase MazF
VVKLRKEYVPERGDLVWLQFDPTTGHEQAGRRPALVLSAKRFNEMTELALCCPVTSKKHWGNLEIEIPDPTKIDGYVLVHQVRSIAWKERRAKFIERAPDFLVIDVVQRLATLLTED